MSYFFGILNNIIISIMFIIDFLIINFFDANLPNTITKRW